MELKLLHVKDLKKILNMLWEIHSYRSELTEYFFEDGKGFLDSAPTPFGWAELYSEPLINLIWYLLATIDTDGELIKELKSKASLAEVEAIFESIDDPELVDFGEGVEHTKYLFLCIWIALMRSLESVQVYGRSLNRLMEDVAQGNDKALFDAVKLDHSITANEHVQRRIAIAELKKDQSFFKRLANCTKSRPEKHSPKLYPLRYMLAVTHEIGLLEKLSMEEAYELFCLELKVYDGNGSDPAGSLWQFIGRWKKDNLKPYYST
ncbi:hypothetical protein [Motiliproteus sediminis]|uniref:hypothetical protein n=1 Tax=Motiliproteus sediminis TaxID=1468178 RepID=UPI001AEFBB9B|nr:hypothetical protein [Motiliproteus sediminis]